MTTILVYDTEAEALEQIAEENELPVAEIVEMLMDYVDDMKSSYNLK